MKKLHTLLALSALLCFNISCASQSIFTYNSQTQQRVDQKSKYHVSQVDIKISKDPNSLEVVWGDKVPNFLKKDFSRYPDEKQMSEIMKDIFEQKLKNNEMYSDNDKDANVFDVTMKVDYIRRGTLKNDAYVVFIMSHDIKISKDGKEIARSVRNKYTMGGYNGDTIVGKRTLFMYGDSEDEINDLNGVFDWIVKELKNLKEVNQG